MRALVASRLEVERAAGIGPDVLHRATGTGPQRRVLQSRHERRKFPPTTQPRPSLNTCATMMRRCSKARGFLGDAGPLQAGRVTGRTACMPSWCCRAGTAQPRPAASP